MQRLCSKVGVCIRHERSLAMYPKVISCCICSEKRCLWWHKARKRSICSRIKVPGVSPQIVCII